MDWTKYSIKGCRGRELRVPVTRRLPGLSALVVVFLFMAPMHALAQEQSNHEIIVSLEPSKIHVKVTFENADPNPIGVDVDEIPGTGIQFSGEWKTVHSDAWPFLENNPSGSVMVMWWTGQGAVDCAVKGKAGRP